MNFRQLLREHTWFVILLALIIGFIWTVPGFYIQPYIGYLLMFLMLLSCIDIKYRDIIKQLHKTKKLFFILVVIHITSPVIIFTLRSFIDSQIFLGLIIATVMSSGLSVVFLSKLYNGEQSEALVMTMTSNLLSPLLVPFLVYIFAREVVILDIMNMVVTILKFVFIPLIIARIIRGTKISKPFRKYSLSLSIVTLFLLILGIVAPIKSIILENINRSIILGIVIVALISINSFLGYILGSTKKEKVTLLLVGSYKNYTLATVTALSLFGPVVALPAILYAFVNNILLVPIHFLFYNKK